MQAICYKILFASVLAFKTNFLLSSKLDTSKTFFYWLQLQHSNYAG